MKVGIDVSPLKTSHKFRGIGSYTKSLVDALQLFKVPNFSIELIEKGGVPVDCDLVHYPYFDLFQTTLPLIKKKKSIVTIHDVIPLVFPKNYPPGLRGKIKFSIQKLSLRGVKAVICDSKNSKKDIFKYLKYPKERIFVVYLAPEEIFKPIKSTILLRRIIVKYGLPRGFVLYVGDVNYNKNLLSLAKACKEIKIPLVIAGKQAAQKEFDQSHIENQPLVQLIKLYGTDPEVIRLGFVPEKDLVIIYNLATVYCQPSFYEGFGLPVLEAMVCGTPVVASNQSSLPEVTGKAAILVDPYDIKEMTTKLKKVIGSRDLQKELSQQGLIQAKKFSWEKVARETYEVYQKVV